MVCSEFLGFVSLGAGVHGVDLVGAVLGQGYRSFASSLESFASSLESFTSKEETHLEYFGPVPERYGMASTLLEQGKATACLEH
jgi:hypothetical protein